MMLFQTDRGFALPAVIFGLAVLAILAVASMTTTGDDRQADLGVRDGTQAFYAAEAGMNAVIANFDSLQYDTLMTAPGDSLDLGWVTLPENGASYWAVIQRVDDGGPAMFALRVEGRTPTGGQRLLTVALRNSGDPIALAGAFQFGGSATVGDGSGFNGGAPVVIDGNDNVPPGWAGVCPPPGPAVPGLAVADITDVSFADSPTIMGDPAILQTPFDTAAFDALYSELVAQATIVFPPGTSLGSGDQIQPVENPPGVCDTSVPTNWGAPEDPTHPCFDYFPIIYVPGGINFKNQPDHAGQGILLMDTGAQLENGFSWYGLIMSLDDIQVEQGKSGCEPANVYGGMYTRNNGSSVKLWGPKWYPADITCNGTEASSSLYYSSCAMQRIALANSSGITPVGGSWRQLFR